MSESNIIFTICSINYLASAKTLCKSLKSTNNSQYQFIYIIADKIDGRIPHDYFEGEEYKEVGEIIDQEFIYKLTKTYNLTEFNTSLKPYIIKYLIEKYKTNKIIYFDPDIIVYNTINHIWKKLDQYNFIVTPHILAPIESEEFYPQQVGVLNTGIFNLGFLAYSHNSDSEKILNWWSYHMKNHGHSKSLIGEFYDQKIMNLLPVFSDQVLIEKNWGYNVAGWNIHERKITKKNNTFYANSDPLIFYHYSGFIHINKKKLISKYNHLKITDNPAVAELIEIYSTSLNKNLHHKLNKLKCYYNVQPDINKISRIEMLSYRIKNILRWLK